jgi:hypothetical protein
VTFDPRTLVRKINLKLAESGRVLAKTKKSKICLGEYSMLNVASGLTDYLTLSELKQMARHLGIATENSTTPGFRQNLRQREIARTEIEAW